MFRFVRRRPSSTSFPPGWRSNIQPRTRAGVLLSIRCNQRLSAIHAGCSFCLAAVALMLLIASVNVANLMLVRTQARSVELAMRTALGASPARLIRQVLLRGTLLAVCGGALGVVLAVWGIDVLVRLAPEGLPRVDEIAIDGRLAAFAVAVTAAVALGFGFWPAWRASRSPLNAAVHGNVRTTAGRRTGRSQLLLVSGELAIAQVLLVAAGLLVASFARLTSVNPGFDPRNLVTADVSLPGAKYGDPMRASDSTRRCSNDWPRRPESMQRQWRCRRRELQSIPLARVRLRAGPILLQANSLMTFITVSENYLEVTGATDLAWTWNSSRRRRAIA